MVSFLILLVFMALVFGLCFLVDKGVARLRRRTENASQVRPPLLYPAMSGALALAAVGCLIYGVLKGKLIYGAAAVVFLGVGIYAMVYYFTTGIRYTDTHFTFRSGKQRKTFAFDDIRGQRVAVSRKSVCLVLCLDRDQVVLYNNMQGFAPFLNRAYKGWCLAKNLDPAGQVWHDPSDHRWFPDQPDDVEEEG